MNDKIFSYSNLSHILIKQGESELRQFILSSLPTTDEDVEEFDKLSKKIDRFITAHSERYKKTCRYNLELFTKKYANWLDQYFVSVEPNDNFDSESANIQPNHPNSFSDSSEKVKRKAIENLRKQVDPLAIERAYVVNLRISDRKIDADIITKLNEADSEMKNRILQILNNNDQKLIPYSPDEALALMIDLRQSKDDYHQMHMGGKAHAANIYPSYHKILEAKKRCYPSSITVSELGAEIDLQVLLDHTSDRIIQLSDVIMSHRSEWNLKLFVKWGMDGASGQSIYKQAFQSAGNSLDDSSIFMTSMVPLQLESDTEIIWSNARPSSTKYCRPISFEFVKETQTGTVQQHQKICAQIEKLVPFTKTQKNTTFRVSFEMELTMIDGKCANHISLNPSQQTCNICGATSSEMNKLDIILSKPCQSERYSLGLSTLHCWIRFLETVLHIAYRLPFKKWQARGKEHQLQVEEEKRRIQKAYKDKKGLTLDQVRQGSGTSNDGNTARRFFDDTEFAAKTTKVNEELICRFKVILVALSCGRNIDPSKFKEYAFETAELFVRLYDWFYMPASVHKVLIHGADVIEALNFPIGMYSEEAQEARNKDFKWFREHNTRKTSRIATNEDLLHALLVSSDPVISSLRREKNKEHRELDVDVVELLSENEFYSEF